MDTLYLTVHVCILNKVIALLGSGLDRVQEICTVLGCDKLMLTAFVNVVPFMTNCLSLTY